MNVLLTGAAGRIGRELLPVLAARHRVRTLDRQPGVDVVADLTDAVALREACAGIEVIVHLAAAASDRFPFVESIVPSNIVGMYRLLEAACETGVRRVVFASTCQTVEGYPPGQVIDPSDPVDPVGPYGASKVFGEALGRVYHRTHGLEFIAVRIGAYQGYDTPHGKSGWLKRLWLSPRDCGRLMLAAVETPGVGYAIVNATSETGEQRLNLAETKAVLGYEPVDRWVDYFGAATRDT